MYFSDSQKLSKNKNYAPLGKKSFYNKSFLLLLGEKRERGESEREGEGWKNCFKKYLTIQHLLVDLLMDLIGKVFSVENTFKKIILELFLLFHKEILLKK